MSNISLRAESTTVLNLAFLSADLHKYNNRLKSCVTHTVISCYIITQAGQNVWAFAQTAPQWWVEDWQMTGSDVRALWHSTHCFHCEQLAVKQDTPQPENRDPLFKVVSTIQSNDLNIFWRLCVKTQEVKTQNFSLKLRSAGCRAAKKPRWERNRILF